ncbi:hypothetical protein [Rugosimonospora africana]|uniref:hypothetical protein n=1 Tax=Rugosimonospora africana TaxID=556532 RepID=UPI001942BD4B|nr:hypothetical protein [Rugosimonospora africana]
MDRGPHPVAWGRFWSFWDDGLFLPRVEATISAAMSVPPVAVEALQLVADAGNCAHVPAALLRPLVSVVRHSAQRLSGWTVSQNIYDYSMSLTRHDYTLNGGASHQVWQVAVRWHRDDPDWDANSVYDGRFHNVYATEREARQAPEGDYRHDSMRGSEQRNPELDLE